MNEIKDFECIEIKSTEDDFNNFVIVRYDWPCNIQEITEVVSKLVKPIISVAALLLNI